LLHVAPITRLASKPAHHRLRTLGFLLAGCLAVLLLAPSAFSFVHELLELLLR
jgi:hypothetical protein